MQKIFRIRDNESLLTDLYEFTMAQSYLENNMQNLVATFEVFIRRLPKNYSYFVVMGIEDSIDKILNLHFSDEDLTYLSSLGFSNQFLKYIAEIKFEGEIRSVREGTIIFPNEPIMQITAPIIQAQILESFVLNTINLQTTLATKASRVVIAANGKPVVEFGLRRTQGEDAALAAAKCSYAAGAIGTSNVLAGKLYNIPVFGTMAHSFIEAFEDEEKAFEAFAKTFPSRTTILVDTYDTIEGTKKAIKIAKDLEKKGYKLSAIRIDSGDLIQLSKECRKLLDEAGLNYVKIMVSGDLDEYKIKELIENGARVDSFGVGTRMSTSSDAPFVDIVYKLVEIQKNGEKIPIVKLSPQKVTLPLRKQVYRKINENGIFEKDVVAEEDEKFEGMQLLFVFVKDGKRIKERETLEQTKDYIKKQIDSLPEELKRIRESNNYKVEVSDSLKAKLEEKQLQIKTKQKVNQ
jgi:nicotinate phosphoribosyltransferase